MQNTKEQRRPTFKRVFQNEEERQMPTSRSRSKSRTRKDSMLPIKTVDKKTSNKIQTPIIEDNSRSNVPNFGGYTTNQQPAPVSNKIQRNLEQCRIRAQKLQSSFLRMEGSLNNLFDKSSMLTLTKQRQYDTFSDVVSNFDERVRRLDDKLNRPLVVLRNLENQMVDRIKQAADGIRGGQNLNVHDSLFNPIKRQPGEAELELKSLEDRLAKLQNLIK